MATTSIYKRKVGTAIVIETNGRTYKIKKRKKRDFHHKKERKDMRLTHEELKPHFEKMLSLLENIRTTKQVRNKNRTVINSVYNLMVGRSTYTLNMKGFETPHEFRKNQGVYIKDIKDSSHSNSLKEAYAKAMEILKMFAPKYAGDSEGNYVVVQFMKMQEGSYVNAHTDKHDIDEQYMFSLGSGKCDTVIFDDEGNEKKRVQIHERILCMDGRIRHKLDSTNLTGTRYSVVYFKMSDPRYSKPAPIRKRSYFLSSPPKELQCE